MAPLPQIGDRPLFLCLLHEVFAAAQDPTNYVVCLLDQSGVREQWAELTYHPAETVSTITFPESLSGDLGYLVPGPHGTRRFQAVAGITIWKDRTFSVMLGDMRKEIHLKGAGCVGWSMWATGQDGTNYSLHFEVRKREELDQLLSEPGA